MPVPVSLLEPATAATGAVSPTTCAVPQRGPIIVATTGDPQSDAAIRIGWLLAGRTGADVRLVTAVESPEVPSTRLQRIQAQLSRALHPSPPWEVTVAEGRAEEVLAQAAATYGAQVVVVGRGRHGLLDRAARGEHVMRLLSRLDVPVYAVEPSVRALARRVVVGMDFSRFAIFAANEALRLCAEDAVVTLAHSWPRAGSITGWEHTYEHAIPHLFEEARRHLSVPEGMQLETVTLVGHSPGASLTEFAVAWGADVAVSSTHGHGTLTRLAIGSVAADLLHNAPCSFFCVPAPAASVHDRLPHIRPTHFPNSLIY